MTDEGEMMTDQMEDASGFKSWFEPKSATTTGTIAISGGMEGDGIRCEG